MLDLGSVGLRFEAKMGDLRRDLDRLRGDLGKTEKKAGGVSSSLKKIGMAIGGVYALKKVGGFFWDTAMAASDFAESMDKAGRVFGPSTVKDMEKWGKTAYKTMGLGAGSAVEAAGTFGNLLTGIGATKQEALGMSKTLVQLAADLGAFNNVPTEEALLAIRSGLTGEMEPMKRFGVLLDQDTLKLKAMEMGLWSGKGALDQQTKALAAYYSMLDQTETEQGNFSDTADGLAGRLKKLSGRWENLKIELGELAVPLVEAAIPALEGFLGWMSDTWLPGAKELYYSLPWVDQPLEATKQSDQIGLQNIYSKYGAGKAPEITPKQQKMLRENVELFNATIESELAMQGFALTGIFENPDWGLYATRIGELVADQMVGGVNDRIEARKSDLRNGIVIAMQTGNWGWLGDKIGSQLTAGILEQLRNLSPDVDRWISAQLSSLGVAGFSYGYGITPVPDEGEGQFGIDRVPKTGSYLLHEDETVFTGTDSDLLGGLAAAIGSTGAATVDELRAIRRGQRRTLTRPTLIGSIGVA